MKTKYTKKFTARFKRDAEERLKIIEDYYKLGSMIGTILFLIEKEYKKIKPKLN